MCLGCLYFHIVVCSQILNFLHNSFTKHLYQCFLAPSFFKLPSPTNYTSLRGPLHSNVLFCIILFFTALYYKILFWHALKQIALYWTIALYTILQNTYLHCTILDYTYCTTLHSHTLHCNNLSSQNSPEKTTDCCWQESVKTFLLTIRAGLEAFTWKI